MSPDALAVGALVLAGPGFDVDVTLGEGLVGGAASTFLTTLIVGAILVAVAPAYVDRLMATVADDPVDSFLFGIVVILALFVVSIALVLTLVGIVVVIPLLLLAWLAWAVGAAVAFLAIAVRLVDPADGWLVPLLVAAALNGGLTLTGAGGLVALAVGAAGFGAVARDALG